MSYYLCDLCHMLIKDQAYQVGEKYYHHTCRPSYQRAFWKTITECSMRVWQAGGLENWRKKDWEFVEIGDDNRRRAKVRGLSVDQIKEALVGYGKPRNEAGEYIFPWDEVKV